MGLRLCYATPFEEGTCDLALIELPVALCRSGPFDKSLFGKTPDRSCYSFSYERRYRKLHRFVCPTSLQNSPERYICTKSPVPSSLHTLNRTLLTVLASAK